MNLWNYQNIGWVRLTTHTGASFLGYPIVVNDIDETESGEVEITLENHEWGRSPFIGFRESEIEKIEIIEE